MSNAFNQLLAGLSGAATGYGQQQDTQRQEARQAANDLALNRDRASQEALRTAAAQRDQALADQRAYLRTPEFAAKYKAARAGDDDAVAHVAGAVSGLPDASSYMAPLTRADKPDPLNARTPRTFTVNGKPIEGFSDAHGKFYDANGNPMSGNITPYTPPKAEPEPQIIQGASPPNPDGTPGAPKFFRVPRGSGDATEIGGIAPKTGAGGTMSGQTMLAAGRIGMSYQDLMQAVSQMEAFEKDPKNIQQFTPGKRTLGAIAQSTPSTEAHGIGGMLGNAATTMASGMAQQHLANDDPAYQNYIYNAQRVGTALTELLPRPNQQLLGIEKGLSAVDVGGNPQQITNVQTRRRGGLTMLKTIMDKGGIGGTAPAASAPAAPATRLLPSERTYLKTQGYTDAQINAKYGPP